MIIPSIGLLSHEISLIWIGPPGIFESLFSGENKIHKNPLTVCQDSLLPEVASCISCLQSVIFSVAKELEVIKRILQILYHNFFISLNFLLLANLSVKLVLYACIFPYYILLVIVHMRA